MLLRQSTDQSRPFQIGVTGLTLTIATSPAGGSFAAPVAPNLTEIGTTGVYVWACNSMDVGTLGAYTYQISGAGLPAGLSMPVDTVVSAPPGVVVQ